MTAAHRASRDRGQKTGKKTGTTMRSPRSGAVVATGAHAANTGGKKGRSGRPPNEFRDFLSRLRDDPAARLALEAAAKDATHPNFRAAWKIITDYDSDGPGADPQKLEVVLRDEGVITWGAERIPL